MNNLIPHVSTHFRFNSDKTPNMTEGKIYKIIRWSELGSGWYFDFLDDDEDESFWPFSPDDDEVSDCSYNTNLENILQ